MVYLVLLEQLTRKKLLIFVICLLIIQIIYFLIGGLIGLFEKVNFNIKKSIRFYLKQQNQHMLLIMILLYVNRNQIINGFIIIQKGIVKKII